MPAGRPTKLTQNLMNKLKEVAEQSLYCTDADLVFLLNEKLKQEEQISLDVFSRYKRGERQQNNPLIQEFVRLIKIILVKEKSELLKQLREGKNNWTAKAWILERKFAEWNLRNLQEVEVKKSEPFKIEVADQETKQLLKQLTKINEDDNSIQEES